MRALVVAQLFCKYGLLTKCEVKMANLVPRSLVDEAEGEIWQSKKICFS